MSFKPVGWSDHTLKIVSWCFLRIILAWTYFDTQDAIVAKMFIGIPEPQKK